MFYNTLLLIKVFMKAVLIVFISLFISISSFAAKLIKYQIMSSGIQREFYLAFSQGQFKRMPVLFAFHGGGGTALNAEKR